MQADFVTRVCDVSTVQTHYGRGRFPQRQTRQTNKTSQLAYTWSRALSSTCKLLPPRPRFPTYFLFLRLTSKLLLFWRVCVCVSSIIHTPKDFGLLSRGAWEGSSAFYSKNKLGVLLIAAAKCLSTSFICLSQWAVVGFVPFLEKPLFLPENWK